METVAAVDVKDGVYVTTARFAEIAGVSPFLVKKWIHAGLIPAKKAKTYLIHLEKGLAALDELMDNVETA